MILPSFVIDHILLFVLGIFDAGIAVAALATTVMQSSYIPHPKSRCSHLATDHRFNYTSSFYELAGRLNGTQVSGKVICENYHEEWRVTIATV